MDDPLKSCHDARPEGSECLGGGAIRLIALILMSAAGGFSQSVAGSISTIQQPIAGHPVFDASGNTYYLSGTARRRQFHSPTVSASVRVVYTDLFPCLAPMWCW